MSEKKSEELYPLELMNDSWLAVDSAIELNRFQRGHQIIDRRVIPYFSNILLNTAQKLRGKEPSEPPLRVFRIPFAFMDFNLFKVAQTAYDMKIPERATTKEAYPLAAQNLEQTALSIRNYRKLSSDELSASVKQLCGLSRAIGTIEHMICPRYLAA